MAGPERNECAVECPRAEKNQCQANRARDKGLFESLCHKGHQLLVDAALETLSASILLKPRFRLSAAR